MVVSGGGIVVGRTPKVCTVLFSLNSVLIELTSDQRLVLNLAPCLSSIYIIPGVSL